jgi:hypothetical protein
MKKPILIVALAAQLTLTSACSLFPNMSSSPINDSDEQTKEEQLLEVKALTEEWKAMKPALVNLIALESDLQYMLENIEQDSDKLKNTTELQLTIETDEEISAYETMTFKDKEDITRNFKEKPEEIEKLSKSPTFADEDLLRKLKGSVDTTSSTQALDESETVDNSTTSTFLPEVNASQPVPDYLKEETKQAQTQSLQDLKKAPANNSQNVTRAKFRTQIKSTNDKFRNMETPDPNNPRLIVGAVNQASFVNKRSQNLKQEGSCVTKSSNIGEGYALHLASYSSLESAMKGWVTLSNKFSAKLCGLTAITDQVTVKNKKFYSLRAGGFETKEMADIACAKFANENQYCRSVRFTGEKLP